MTLWVLSFNAVLEQHLRIVTSSRANVCSCKRKFWLASDALTFAPTISVNPYVVSIRFSSIMRMHSSLQQILNSHGASLTRWPSYRRSENPSPTSQPLCSFIPTTLISSMLSELLSKLADYDNRGFQFSSSFFVLSLIMFFLYSP